MTSISTNEYKTVGRNLDIILQDLADITNEIVTFDFFTKEETVSDLKKQIKHCKNHMERKKLEQKLNALYKKRKVK